MTNLEKEDMLIVENKRKFLKKINTKKNFECEIVLNKVKKFKDLYLTQLSYNFEEGSCRGKMKLVLETKNEKYQM